MAMPAKWTDPEEMAQAIDAYFTECEGKILTDDNGKVIVDKFGRPVIVGIKPPTASGLAYALGFKTRKSLLDYKGKKAFRDVIDRAKLRLQVYTEERLYDRDGQRGAEFSLKYNFDGKEADPKTSTEADGTQVVKIICDIPRGVETPDGTTQTTATAGEVETHGD